MRSSTKKRISAVADDYLDLVKRFPLRPLRSEAEHARAIEIHRALLRRANAPGLTAGESDYADALVRFIRDYEESWEAGHFPKEKVSPIELLRYLMRENSMNTVQLGELLGSGKGQASMILNGKRELSKANIRVLAERFKVNAGAFI